MLFFVPTSAPRLVQEMPWYVLFCLWNSAYKDTLLLIETIVARVAVAGFLSHYRNGPQPYVQHFLPSLSN